MHNLTEASEDDEISISFIYDPIEITEPEIICVTWFG